VIIENEAIKERPYESLPNAKQDPEPAKPKSQLTIPKNFKASIQVNHSNSSLLTKNSKGVNSSMDYHSKSTIDFSSSHNTSKLKLKSNLNKSVNIDKSMRST
jgi:hypothetical protein